MNVALLYLEVAKTTNLPFDLREFFRLLHERSLLYIERYAQGYGEEWKRETMTKLHAATQNAEDLMARLESLVTSGSVISAVASSSESEKDAKSFSDDN